LSEDCRETLERARSRIKAEKRRTPRVLASVHAIIVGVGSTDSGFFDDVRPLIDVAKVELAPPYLEYVFTVSDPAWTISLELAAFLLALCRATDPLAIADLGSGFSSFVFRTYALQSRSDIRVVSVDDSSAWLLRTEDFLRSCDLPTDELVTSDEFARTSRGVFDLVFHDLGNMAARRESLGWAIDSARPEAMVVLDDLHMEGYPDLVDRTARAQGRQVVDLAPFTRDAIDRYAWALLPALDSGSRSA
jgi:predicted O-methyltransferase YrrM